MANDPTDTGPVWSTTIYELGPCAACGSPYDDLTSDEYLQYTHCGGTGAICINKTNGMTCSTGTAPDIGDFPGAIIDFMFWGSGAYGLSPDGTVWPIGGAAEPVWDSGGPLQVGPWDNLFGINPYTIGVSKITSTGYVSLKATVNSIASHTCCD